MSDIPITPESSGNNEKLWTTILPIYFIACIAAIGLTTCFFSCLKKLSNRSETNLTDVNFISSLNNGLNEINTNQYTELNDSNPIAKSHSTNSESPGLNPSAPLIDAHKELTPLK